MLPLLYKDRRKEGETVLRQCQLVQLHLLYVLDDICKKAGIPYFLIGGTLLGAMRHDGFIPWDDDLDVGVPYDRYDELKYVLRRDLPKDVGMQIPGDNKYTAIPIIKIRDRYSFYCECRPDITMADPSGIYLDIFPWEEMPEIGKSLQRFFILSLSSSWSRARGLRNAAKRFLLKGLLYQVGAMMLDIVHFVLRMFLSLLKHLFPMRSVSFLCESGWTHLYDKSDVYPLTTHKFEDGVFPVPSNSDRVLMLQYGDWRKIPPPDKRPRHAKIIDPFHSSVDNGEIEYFRVKSKIG